MAVNLLAQASFKNAYNIIDGMEGDLVKDPDNLFRRQENEKRVEDLGSAMDVRCRSGPCAPSR